MITNHVVIWIDLKQAHILYFDTSKNELIQSESTQRHLNHKANEIGSGKAPEDHQFFHKIISAVVNVNEILVVGPGPAKGELLKHAAVHDPAIAKHIIGVETVNHLTDGQVIAYAKKYFKRVNSLKGN